MAFPKNSSSASSIKTTGKISKNPRVEVESKGKKPSKSKAEKVVAKTKTTSVSKSSAAIGERALEQVYKVKKAYPDGVRAEFMTAIPKAGAPLATIAKKAGVTVQKARGYAYWLASNGYLTRVEA